jgi:hypothetical protein
VLTPSPSSLLVVMAALVRESEGRAMTTVRLSATLSANMRVVAPYSARWRRIVGQWCMKRSIGCGRANCRSTACSMVFGLERRRQLPEAMVG